MDDSALAAAISKVLPSIDWNSEPENFPRLQDDSVAKVSELLSKHDDEDGSRRPRTYALLYFIRQTKYHTAFNGKSDDLLPYFDWTIPAGIMDDNARRCFFKYQYLVLPADIDAVEPRERPHMHFNSEDDCQLSTTGVLGSGAYGIVDIVCGKFSQKKYARKRLRRSNSADSEEKLKTFDNELGALKRLKHHHLVRYVGSYTDPKWKAFTMEPIADHDLAEWIAHYSSKDTVRHFFGCLASAVAYLHRNAVRHKDIKPRNILVHEGRIYVSDFGSSRDWKMSDSSTTTGRAIAFTRRYAAPEVLNNDERNSSSDVFSLGCVFLELATSLCGRQVSDLNQHLRENGTNSPIFAENEQAVRSWIAELKKCYHSEADMRIVDTILRMLDGDKGNRPKASTLADTIVDFGAQFSCKQCCTERIVRHLETEDVHILDPAQRGPALCEAARQGNLTIFQSLLGITDDLSYKAPLGTSERVRATALEIAMEFSHVELVKTLLSHCRAKGETPDMRRALFLAVEHRNESGVNSLLEFGANQSSNVTGDGIMSCSPFYYAVRNKRVAIATNMINRGFGLMHKEKATGRTLLHGAVRGGDHELLKLLLERNLNVNAKDSDGFTPLHEAVRKGDKELMETLLEAKADPNVPDQRGDSPIIRATRNGHAHLIGPLVSAGVNPHIQDSNGQPASCIASSDGRIAVLEAILDSVGPDNHRDKNGQTPLHHAVKAQHISTVDMLLRRTPADLQHQDDLEKCTPLHLAAQHLSLPILQTLLCWQHAPTRVKDSYGYTPLRRAVWHNKSESNKFFESCLRLLLETDPATVDVQSKSLTTLSILSCTWNYTNTLQILVEKGANLDLVDRSGKTALHRAAIHGNVDCVKILLSKGALVDILNPYGYSALGLAAKEGQTSTMALLLDQGKFELDKTFPKFQGSTQLMIAAADGSLQAVQTLLNMGASIDIKNDKGESALLLAIFGGHSDVAKFLLEMGCEAEAESVNGINPILVAAGRNHKEVVEALIARGVSLEAETKKGNTAISIAAIRGHIEVMITLANAGANLDKIPSKSQRLYMPYIQGST